MVNGISGVNFSVAKNIANAEKPDVPGSQELPRRPMEALRPELKALVSKNLNVQENKDLRLIDKSFRQEGAFQLQAFKVPANEIVNLKRILAVAENLPKIKKIELSGFSNPVTPELRQLAALDLACLEKITHLTLPELAFNDRTPNRLQGLTPSEKLAMESCPGYVKAVQKEETRLRELSRLQNMTITDAGLAHLQGLTHLQPLNLAASATITDAGLAHLLAMAPLLPLPEPH